jgi:hypothetical protein
MSTTKAPGVYDRVGKKTGPLVIGGAERKWKEDPTFTYVPKYRKAAPYDEVVDWLEAKHPKRVKEALRGAFNPKNLKKKDVREAYNRERENAEEERQSANEERKRKLNINLEAVVRLNDLHRKQKREEKDDRPVSSKRPTTLKEKVKLLKSEGKVLDVTNMTDSGTKATKTTWTGKGVKRRLSTDRHDRFYYVVYNPNKEKAADGVENFLNLYGGFDETSVENVVETIRDGNKVNFLRGKSPSRRSPILSPKSKSRKKKSSKKKKEKKASKEKSKKASRKKKEESDSEASDSNDSGEEDVFDGLSDDE